ncbi:MAG: hypothetical protein ACI9TH_005183 [Kiritimatiellia bacterium]|jgi:hypothetical protein
MKRSIGIPVLILILSSTLLPTWGDEPARLAELDAYWAEVSRAVGEGDFDAYKATTHPEGVLVAGTNGSCIPLAKALANWEQDFIDTASGKKKGSVAFRFAQRLGDATTAHETGIFLYATVDTEGKTTAEYIHFEGLLVKRGVDWKIMMEYQKSRATQAEWKALKQTP